MSLTLWRCKRLTSGIWKHEDRIKRLQKAIKTLSKWIKQDRGKLNGLLKTLSEEENLQYGLQMGLIDDVDYDFIKKRIKVKK